MKNFILRCIAFVIIFVALFWIAQSICHYRLANSEDLYSRNIDFARQQAETIDVVAFGTSELYAAYIPAVTYYERGITGYNFATTARSAVTTYYQLLYALEYQTPNVVICDFSCLYDDMTPSDSERIYRKVVECMPDRRLKQRLIHEICSIDESQSYITWKFPLLRYHYIWNELTKENFERDYIYNESYPTFSKGAELRFGSADFEMFDVNPDLWTFKEKESVFSDFSVKYYDMMIKECCSRGIQVVAVLTPKLSDASLYASRIDAMQEYFDSRGVICLNYNTYDEFSRLNLDLLEDYYDASHLNILGGTKFSRSLADDLCRELNLIDHRDDPLYSKEWDAAWEEFDYYLKHGNEEVEQ